MLKKRIFLTLVVATLTAVAELHAEELSTQYSATQREITEHRCGRGLVRLNTPFVPEGQWILGATASYSAHVNDNYTFAIVEGITSNGYTLNVSPILAYAFADNMAAGVRFEYGRSLLEIDSAYLSFGEGDSNTELSLQDYYALQHSYTAMAIFRQYIPLGRAKRFALFAEVQVEGGAFESKMAYDQPVEGTFSKGYSVGVGVVPGIVAFATNNVAFEVCVGMLGVGYSHTEQVHNQVYTGESQSANMNFKINLLSIGLGVSIYL